MLVQAMTSFAALRTTEYERAWRLAVRKSMTRLNRSLG